MTMALLKSVNDVPGVDFLFIQVKGAAFDFAVEV